MAQSAVVGLLRVLLTADTAQFDTAMKRVGSSAQAWSKDLGSIGRQASQLGASLTRTLTLPIVGAGVGMVKAAADFESSFAGVRKTVDATEPEFKALAQEFRNLAKEIPINVNELNRLGEAAGALGIKKDDIKEFTRVAALMGQTTNLSSEEAANAMARIQNIFGAAGKDTDRLASTIVALGNAGASTESEIAEMSLRIAGAGHAVGLSQDQVAAFASTLSSVGINAEAGGSAISRVFLKMNDAVMSGGPALEEFARVAGMSAAEFKQAFQTDAAGATSAFISGLGRLKGEGENVNATVEGLVGRNIILKDTLLRLTGAGELLNEQLALGNSAWKDNTALTDEAGKRFETAHSKLTLLWNRVKDLGITLGETLMPIFERVVAVAEGFIPVIEKLAKGFTSLPEPLQTAVVGLAGIAAAVGPATWFFGQLATAAGLVAKAFASGGLLAKAVTFLTGTSLPAIGTALMSILTGPIGWVIGGIAALAAAWYVWGDDITAVVKNTYAAIKEWLWDKFKPVLEPIGELLVAVKDMFVAFGELVGAVVMKVVGYAAELFKGVKNWLWDKLKPVLEPVAKLFSPIATIFGAVKDKVVNFAQALYEGVKLYLITRFTSIVDGIKQKIEAVTEFFRKMHAAVVGNSYVPEMIDGIKREFGRLGDVMVNPVKVGTDQVMSYFNGMMRNVTDGLSKWGTSLSNVITSKISGPIGSALGGVATKLLGGLAGFITGGVSQLVALGVDLAWQGIKWLGGKIWDGIKALGGWLFSGGMTGDELRAKLDAEGRTGSSARQRPPGALSGGFAVPRFPAGGIIEQPSMAMIEWPHASMPPMSSDTEGGVTDGVATTLRALVDRLSILIDNAGDYILTVDSEVLGRVTGRQRATHEELSKGIELNTFGLGTAVRRAVS